MVVVLADEFRQLLLRVSVKRIGDRHAVDDRYFRPYDHAGAVAEMVEIFSMLVMREPQARAPHLPQQSEIPQMFGRADGPSAVEPVLMAVDAVQIKIGAVQIKPVIRVNAEKPEPKGLVDNIGCRCAVRNLDIYPIEIGIGKAVPEMGGCYRSGLDKVIR